MSAQKQHFRLGVFVLAALSICIILAIAFGAGRWTRTTITLESYFNESVQGIDIGSKVKYRGVIVGEVSHIGFTYSRYQQELPPGERQQYVLLEAKLRPELFGGKNMPFPDQTYLNKEIEKGLRVRLNPQGLTGTSYLEIDYQPAGTPPAPITWKPDNLYIPSARGTVSQLVSATQNLALKLQKLDIEGLINNLNHVLDSANQKMNDVPVQALTQKMLIILEKLEKVPFAELSAEASGLMQEARVSNQSIQKLLADPAWASMPADLAASTRQARTLLENPSLSGSLQKMESSLNRLDQLLAQHEGGLDITMNNLQQISEDLRVISESARTNPAGLLLGKPPAPYQLPVQKNK
ncbi:MCE family protein [Iodobacter sp. HSC-16F04]|uniref:MCE family protein n=1 Tax=Iodobacter violaceini TaxID=3044271 RepID=A0ABX0KPV7_9NEIS|nr:MlaD family protein [Iodobacter violacea]NHQ85877.1 MCE family protein [Iodobacter violacea]